MGIVLGILKILGIVVLVLLGILIVAVICIAFFPISYRVAASYEETLLANAKIYWLFHLLSVTVSYDKDVKKCILRIAGIPVADFFHKKPAKQKKSKSVKPKKTKKKKATVQDIKAAKQTPPEKNEFQEKKESQEKKEFRKTTAETTEQPKSKSKLKEFFEKIVSFPGRLLRMIKNIKEKLTAFYQNKAEQKKKLDKWLEVLGREQTKTAVGKAKTTIWKVLKSILPRKWNAYIHFGFEDPATTGQLLGYYWMFIGLWGNHFVCVPDFENKVFSGNINAKGKLQVFKFLYAAYKFMFDKDLIYLRKINSEVQS